MFHFALLGVFAALETVSPWYSMLCSIPVYVTGGAASYLTVLLCYISDVTDETNRGVRMGIFEAVLALGIFLGNISSSYIFLATNYPTVFAIAATCCLLNFVFTATFIPESVANPETEGRLRGLFRITNIKDMLTTTFKPRRNYDRFIVLCCILILTIFIVAVNGDGALAFLYVREKFHWSLQQYTLYSAAHNVAWVVGTLFGTYVLHKLMKIPETFMLLVGFTSMFFGMLMMGLAIYDWEVYAGKYVF